MSRCRSRFHTPQVWTEGVDVQVPDSAGMFHTFHTFHTYPRAHVRPRVHTLERPRAHARTPVFFGMEGMEGMEEPASMRLSGSIPFVHTLEVWKVSGSLREEMPAVAAFGDELRQAFGREYVDGAIRQGLRGRPVFWASENGREIGTAWGRVEEEGRRAPIDA
jgi:hypothetical protein